jgi:hypothetical protein
MLFSVVLVQVFTHFFVEPLVKRHLAFSRVSVILESIGLLIVDLHALSGSVAQMAGTIHIHRLGGRYCDAARKYMVLIDGKPAGAVNPGHNLAVSAEAGRHVVRLEINWCRSRDVEVEVPEGGEVHLDCRPSGGAWRALWDISVGAGKYMSVGPRG